MRRTMRAVQIDTTYTESRKAETPPKAKKYTDRTRAKDRTCKDKRGKKGMQNSDRLFCNNDTAQCMKPNHGQRMFTREALNAIFTKADVFLPMPQHDDHSHDGHGHIDASEQPRWRRRLKQVSVVNPAFKARKSK